MSDVQSSVIVCSDQGMYSVFECTLENARQLVHAALQSRRFCQSRLKVFDEASRNGITFRRASIFAKAMKSILIYEVSSIELARLLYKDERRKEVAMITPEMRETLMVAIVREAGIDQSCLDFCDRMDLEAFGRLWKRLDFLQVARDEFGEDVHFQHDDLFDDLSLLRSIENNKWKEGSPTSRIVKSYHCKFLNRYATGIWDVEAVQSTVSHDFVF